MHLNTAIPVATRVCKSEASPRATALAQITWAAAEGARGAACGLVMWDLAVAARIGSSSAAPSIRGHDAPSGGTLLAARASLGLDGLALPFQPLV